MAFVLSQRSKSRLVGVHPKLVEVVHRAIQITPVDFGVTFGVRDLETQRKLVAAKRSTTLKSKHLIQDDGYGHAVDVVAYVDTGDGPEVCWELPIYDDIADAFKEASEEKGLTLRWGCAWHCHLTGQQKNAEQLRNEYIDLRKSQGRSYFLDGPHLEIMQLS